jgi:DNA-binding MarR family transcriptional regulator
MVSNWLGDDEERAWRNFRRMFTLLEAKLAGELTEQTGLSMSDYTVLTNLVDADDHRFRISSLAQQMTWSQSRLSHQIKRMESRGLVAKEDVASDGRGAFVRLTRKGLKALATATPTHMTGVREHMIDLLTAEQIKALDVIALTVVTHLRESANSDG